MKKYFISFGILSSLLSLTIIKQSGLVSSLKTIVFVDICIAGIGVIMFLIFCYVLEDVIKGI